MKTLKNFFKYFIIGLFLTPFCGALADMDCGNGWVSVSTPDNPVTEATVLAQCGKPTYKHTWTEKHTSYSIPYSHATDYEQKNVYTVNYSRWTYNRGSNTFIEYLLFRNGVLVNLTEGDYGTD